MHGLRQILAARGQTFWLLALMALSIRALVPAGYMPDQGKDGTLTVRICAPEDYGQPRTLQIAIPRKGDAGDRNHLAAQTHCAFAGLGLAAIAADDALLADRAPLYVVPEQQRLIALQLSAPQYWRPPLRAPPHTA